MVFAVDHHIDHGGLGLEEGPYKEEGQKKGMLEHVSGLCD